VWSLFRCLVSSVNVLLFALLYLLAFEVFRIWKSLRDNLSWIVNQLGGRDVATLVWRKFWDLPVRKRLSTKCRRSFDAFSSMWFVRFADDCRHERSYFVRLILLRSSSLFLSRTCVTGVSVGLEILNLFENRNNQLQVDVLPLIEKNTRQDSTNVVAR
jgi:hypothetical protein